MPDVVGDKSKQPAECDEAKNGKCLHIKCTYEGWDDSTYECGVCGLRYKLYEDEMK